MQAAFLPSNAPEEIVSKLFNVFGHRHTSREMSFDDFITLHYLLSPTENV
jgi:Ca2+-binding EF-hand superfamily protein